MIIKPDTTMRPLYSGVRLKPLAWLLVYVQAELLYLTGSKLICGCMFSVADHINPVSMQHVDERGIRRGLLFGIM